MQKKDPVIYLKHILNSIDLILHYTDGMDEDAFLADQLVKDGCVRNFEIIGEATKHIQPAFREKYPDIEWRKMAGMRDKLIHDYIAVDYGVVWATVEDILPGLKQAIESIIDTEENKTA